MSNTKRVHVVEKMSQTTTRQVRPDSEASTTDPEAKMQQQHNECVPNARCHFLVASGSYPFSTVTYQRKWIFKDL